jgi:putative transposase
VGPNPTDRAKNGTKRSVICDAEGYALGAAIAGANVHDTKLLEQTIEAIVVERPKPTGKKPQNLCLDAGYDNPTGRTTTAKHKYVAHIRPIRDKRRVPRGKKHKPRRWVVERLLAWLSKCRAILVRYDKNSYNYLGLIQLACALFWFRRLHRMGFT